MSITANWLGRWGLGKDAQQTDALPVRLGRHANYANAQSISRVSSLDHALIAVVCTLLVWGAIMVYSATIAMPDNPKYLGYTHNHFLVRHFASIATGLLAGLIAFQVPVQTW
jgi:cell division protein FtsW